MKRIRNTATGIYETGLAVFVYVYCLTLFAIFAFSGFKIGDAFITVALVLGYFLVLGFVKIHAVMIEAMDLETKKVDSKVVSFIINLVQRNYLHVIVDVVVLWGVGPSILPFLAVKWFAILPLSISKVVNYY